MKLIKGVTYAVWFMLAAVSSAQAQTVSTAERVRQMEQEIARIEAICEPARGTTRIEVEKKFGVGHPTVNTKTSNHPIPEDSPYRIYEFCPDGTLQVSYDKDWKVRWAHFSGPYHDPIMAHNRQNPLSQHERLLVAEARLTQMQSILQEYQKRFPETEK